MSTKTKRRADPYAPGDPLRITKSIDQLQPKSLVCLLERESYETQGENLPDQDRNLRREMNTRGHTVVGVYPHRIRSGADIGELWNVADYARKLSKQYGRKVYPVAESFDRVIRNKHFHSAKNRRAVPTFADVRYAQMMLRGEIIYTVESPTSTNEQQHGAHIKRGQRCKGRRGGRQLKKHTPGYRKKRLAKGLHKALKYRLVRGLSWRQIVKRLRRKYQIEISLSGLRKWIKTHA
jgi:hypothetical protein